MAINTSKDIQDLAKTTAQEISDNITFSGAGHNLAAQISDALTTTVDVGFQKQIAYIEVMDTMSTLDDKYEHIYRGELALGVGKIYRYLGFRQSSPSNPETNEWVRSGPLKKLDRWTSTHTGNIFSQSGGDYTVTEFLEFSRTSQGLTDLLLREQNGPIFTKQLEEREISRYLMRVKKDKLTKILPQYIQDKLDPIRNALGKNVVKLGATTSAKEKIAKLINFMDYFYLDHSDQYNAGGGQGTTEDDKKYIWVDGVKTNVPVKINTPLKSDIVAYMTPKLKNDLLKEAQDTFNPEWVKKYEDLFSKVIYDDFLDEDDILIADKSVVQIYSMFQEYGVDYYLAKPAFSTIYHWKTHYEFLPILNAFAIKYVD